MDDLRAIKRRIKSVTGIKQITKAMEMVSANKLRRTQDRIEKARPYVQKLDDILRDILSSTSAEELRHPLTTSAEEGMAVKRVALVLFTSDKGLCGSFNANLIRRAVAVMAEGKAKGIEYGLIPIGRRGLDYFRRRNVHIIRDDLVRIDQNLPVRFLNKLYKFLVGLYTGEGHDDDDFIPYDRVDIIFSLFKSAMVQHIELITLLPLEMGPAVGEEGAYGETLEYIFEPGPVDLFNDIIPQVITMRIFSALAESITSEHGARMTAMKNATDNAGEMVDWLTLQRNKARQSSITRELSDIVGGAEALR